MLASATMGYLRDFIGPARHVVALLLVSLSVLAVEPNAWAQGDDDRAGARVAATEGVKAMNEKRWADAADLFSRAESLVHSPVHLLYLARAQEQLGKLVKARENYNRIIREHVPPDAPDAFRQAQTSAHQEAGGIDSRLATITVKLDGEKGSPTVTMDGERVPPALLGLPLPVDPGSHTFQAASAGLRSEPVTVSVTEGGKDVVTLTLRAAPGTSAPVSDAAPGPTGTTSVSQAPASTALTSTTAPPAGTTEHESSGGPSGLKVGGYVALGVGVVGVGVGTLFLLQSKSKKSDANNLCNLANGGCPLSKKSDVDALDRDYKSAGTLSVVGYAVGGAGLIAGAVLLFSSGSQHTESAGLTPFIGPQSAGVFGRF